MPLITTLVQPGRPYMAVHMAGNQTPSSGVATLMSFDTVDIGLNFSSNVWTPPTAGKYWVSAILNCTATVAALTSQIGAIWKNGATFISASISEPISTGGAFSIALAGLVSMNGTTDTLSVAANITGTSGTVVGGALSGGGSFFSAFFVGS